MILRPTSKTIHDCYKTGTTTSRNIEQQYNLKNDIIHQKPRKENCNGHHVMKGRKLLAAPVIILQYYLSVERARLYINCIQSYIASTSQKIQSLSLQIQMSNSGYRVLMTHHQRIQIYIKEITCAIEHLRVGIFLTGEYEGDDVCMYIYPRLERIHSSPQIQIYWAYHW